MNISKQIEYWKNNAFVDFETAEILIKKNKILHGLFFCHLTIEKILKAHFVKKNNNIAPKTHDLIYLVDECLFTFEDNKLEFLTLLMKYQLAGRYPDYQPSIPQKGKAKKYLSETKELLEWLSKRL